MPSLIKHADVHAPSVKHHNLHTRVTIKGSRLEQMTTSFSSSVLASLLILLQCTTAQCSDNGQNISCVSRYYEFEEAAITNNSQNVDALFRELYKPNHPLPYSLAVHYQIRLDNGTTQRISSDPNCTSEIWMWTYSPVFLLAEPGLFNRITIYTINYFRSWNAPTVTLTVPLPCEGSTSDFLNRMTMSVNEYAHGRVKHTKYLGYVLRGCGLKVEETRMTANENANFKTNSIQKMHTNTLAAGICFQVILICLGTALLLQHWMPVIADRSLKCSQTYSMLWAVVTTAVIFWVLVTAADMYSFVIVYKLNKITFSVCTILAYFPAILEFPVAVYFARKYSFAIPSLYLAPVKFFCRGKDSQASFLLRLMSLWALLAAIQLACVHGIPIVVAAVAAPYSVISNVLVIVFILFCLVHVFAIFYTLPPIPTRKSNGSSGMGLRSTLLHGISFVLLLVTLVCFALVGAGLGYIINISSSQDAICNLDKAILPAMLCATGFGLRKLSNLWWSTYATTPKEGEEVNQRADVHKIGYEAI